MFRSSHFLFLVFGHSWRQSYENTKMLRNLCLRFARQEGKKRKEIHAFKVTKIPKTKIWDERNIRSSNVLHFFRLSLIFS